MTDVCTAHRNSSNLLTHKTEQEQMSELPSIRELVVKADNTNFLFCSISQNLSTQLGAGVHHCMAFEIFGYGSHTARTYFH